jgi:hypothetical protein
MADPPRYPDTSRGQERGEGLPRWLKLSLIVVAIVALLIATLMLTGVFGAHGPMRHF